jgi:hypothetical protein
MVRVVRFWPRMEGLCILSTILVRETSSRRSCAKLLTAVRHPVASWFPSQSSSEEAEAQQSAGSHSSTKPPPAAQNSPLAIFPTSPPTSEPPMPVEQREINTSNQSRVRKLQSREVDLPPGGSNIKKLRTEREGHSGQAVQGNMTSPALKPAHSNTNSKPVSHDHKPVSHAQTAPPHTAVASRRSLAFNSSAEKQPVFTVIFQCNRFMTVH